MGTGYHASKEQVDAELAEVFEQIFREIAEAMLEAVKNLWPPAPGGGLVPAHNRRLWTLARWAYCRRDRVDHRGHRKGYEYGQRFLEAIGEKPSHENVLLLPRLLGPHFDPEGNDLEDGNRKPWKRGQFETRSQQRAIEFLKGRLRSIKREIEKENVRKALILQGATDEEIEEATAKKFLRAQDHKPNEYWELDLRELRVRNDIYKTLPKAQADAVWALTLYEHPDKRVTSWVAEQLGVKPATLRKWRSGAKNHPDLRRNIGL